MVGCSHLEESCNRQDLLIDGEHYVAPESDRLIDISQSVSNYVQSQQLCSISAQSGLFSALSAAYKHLAELSRIIERTPEASRFQIYL